MPGHHGESQTQKSDVLDSDSGSVVGTNFNTDKSVLKYPLDFKNQFSIQKSFYHFALKFFIFNGCVFRL